MSIDVHVNTMQEEDAFIFLMEISTPEMPETIRIANNNEDVYHNGTKYEAFPFEVTLPPDDGKPPQALRVTTAFTGWDFIKLLRGVEEPPAVKIMLITTDNPNVAHKSIDFLKVGNVEYDSIAINFTLVSNSAFARKTQRHTYNQQEFPGLFYAIQ